MIDALRRFLHLTQADKGDKVGLVLPKGERHFRVLTVERKDGGLDHLIKCWNDPQDEAEAPWLALGVLR